jgi:hypothetical protein
VIREDRFVQSHRPYAVDLASFRTIDPDDGNGIVADPAKWTWVRIDAVWFRRRAGITVACAGSLRDLQRPAPADAQQFLARHEDGRHGGDCRARWDGERFWSGSQDPEVSARYLALLKPMLAAFPQIPAGYSGWWRF